MHEGASLGPYRIDRELGSGGMGSVYAAVVEGPCPSLAEGARVALKVVHPHLLEAPGFFKRFLREAELGQSIRHPNVVRTHDCDQVIVDGAANAFLVMEYVEGQTLRELLDELERVPEELCRHIAREVCKGLASIHAAGVIHRDMKPDNVLITEEHVVKVMDLGVARLQDEALRLSQTGAFVGSIHYAAPECFRAGGRDVDGRADLHALGLVLYELACGVNPYAADDVPEIVHRVLHEEPRRLGEVNPQLSPFFEEVVHCLLAKSPGERFADAGQLLGVLEAGEDSDWWRARSRSIQALTRRPLRRIRIPRETAVYGRETELEKLRAIYDCALRHDGQLVLLEGEAGIGKSRLVDEFIARLQRDGEDINFLFGSYPPGGASSAAGAFSTAFREQLGADGAAHYLLRTPVLVPAFEALLRGDATPAGAEPLTQDSLVTCFVQALRGLAAELPTVVLIDDLHFAPEDAVGLFSALAMALPGHRALLIGTTRPSAEGDWRSNLARLPHVTRLSVERLFPKDLVALLQDSFQSAALAASLSAQIAVKSDGNPFFAFEIIRGLREGQFITQTDDGTWVSTQAIDEIRIPSSVLDLVKARVADLTEEQRDLLDVASCLGFEFDPGLVGDVLGLGRIAVLKGFSQIERKHRLVRAAGRHMVFDHHQVQEALYGSLLEQLREEYHAALAAALERSTQAREADPESLPGALCMELVQHFLRSARADLAVRYLDAALTHLVQGHMLAEMVAVAERVLAVPDLLVGRARAATLLRLCEVNGPLDRMGRSVRQEECAQEAVRVAEEVGDPELIGVTLNALGWALFRASRNAEAEVVLRRALEIFTRGGDAQLESRGTVNLGAVLRSLGRPLEAQALFERNLVLSREAGNRRSEAVAFGNLGMLHRAQGRLDEAQRCLERSVELSRDEGSLQTESAATGNLGNVLFSQGRYTEAERLMQRCLGLICELGDRRGEAITTGNLGLLLLSQGRLAEARGAFERSLPLCRETANRVGEAIAQINLGTVLREQGETSPAEEHLLIGIALCEETENLREAASAHLALGSLRSAQGDVARGREALETARELAADAELPGCEALARCELACLPEGDSGAALAALATHGVRLEPQELRDAHWLLWRATGDAAHLTEAWRLLQDSLANVDDAARRTVFTSLRIPRAIVAARKAQRAD